MKETKIIQFPSRCR